MGGPGIGSLMVAVHVCPPQPSGLACLQAQYECLRGCAACCAACRLKMGVCEGVPRAVLPDHMGKADYLGVCVNTAARCAGKGSGEGGGSVPAADTGFGASFSH